MIHIRGHTTDFSQRVEALEVNHAAGDRSRIERRFRRKGG
jgi:hypothetical protein